MKEHSFIGSTIIKDIKFLAGVRISSSTTMNGGTGRAIQTALKESLSLKVRASWQWLMLSMP